MIDLFKLILKFRNVDNFENDTAFFLTHLPIVAPQAYLNIIFRPTAPDVSAEVGARLMIPVPIQEFLQRYNGVHLLSNSLIVCGVHRKGQLLNRNDIFQLPPINIETESRHYAPSDRQRFFKFGAYGYDGSGVCMDRHDHSIAVFKRRAEEPYCAWSSLDEWLESEIQRISELFDESGIRLRDESETLPPPNTGCSEK